MGEIKIVSNRASVLEEVRLLKYMREQGNAVGLAESVARNHVIFTDVYQEGQETLHFFAIPAGGIATYVGD